MSSIDPNEEALRSKYKEIAELKAALIQKKILKKRQAAHAARVEKRSPYGSYSSSRNLGNSHPQSRKFSNLKLVMNHGIPSLEGNSSPALTEGYVCVQSSGRNSLINVNVYADEEKKLKQKIKLKQQQKKIEKIKANIASKRALYSNCDRIKINGDKYSVVQGGFRLYPVTMYQLTNPNTCVWNGIEYKRNPNSGVFKPLTKTGRIRYVLNNSTISLLIDSFLTTHTRYPKQGCKYFQNTGMCGKGSSCKYVHDKERIRICPLFLADKCYGKNCLLSHRPNDCNTPVCRYYLDKNCTNPNCKYRHFKPDHYDDPDYEILTCRQFVGGYCPRGKKCPFLHLLNCPDFEEENLCIFGQQCALAHRFTLRTQDLIASRSNKYIRDETVVTDQEIPTPKKTIISSYTVDPKLLFAIDLTGNYQFYIDNEGNPSSRGLKEFLIELSDSEEDSEEDFDEVSDGSYNGGIDLNDDYVGV